MIKVLLDENVPQRLKFRLNKDFDVSTIPENGWASKQNGELMNLINKYKFTHFVTCDQNIAYQQNLNLIQFKLIVLIAFKNDYNVLLNYVEQILEVINDTHHSEKLVKIYNENS